MLALFLAGLFLPSPRHVSNRGIRDADALLSDGVTEQIDNLCVHASALSLRQRFKFILQIIRETNGNADFRDFRLNRQAQIPVMLYAFKEAVLRGVAPLAERLNIIQRVSASRRTGLDVIHGKRLFFATGSAPVVVHFADTEPVFHSECICLLYTSDAADDTR